LDFTVSDRRPVCSHGDKGAGVLFSPARWHVGYEWVMARALDPPDLSRAYDECIVAGVFQETGDYYVRYRNRYEGVLLTYAALNGDGTLDVLEIGGGQHALLAHAVLGDRATVADLPGPHLDYLRSRGVSTVQWDLLSDEQPFRGAFDRVFLCEVMSHLPVPPHEYLARIRVALRPGGVLLVSTPNLHRIRNIARLLLGREPFSPMVKPEPGTWRGSFLDFSAEHLRWQLDRAGFVAINVERREFGHRASSVSARLANLVLRPVTWIPRFQYNLLATATAP
jgi:SAM-dependent methyltransferase